MGFLTSGIEAGMRTADPATVYRESRRAFRFSDGQQLYYMGLLGFETHSRVSQRGENIPQVLNYVQYVLGSEIGDTERSQLPIIQAAAVLPNLAWHDGNHLSEVVKHAQQLLEQVKNPLLARENAAGALKNAAWYKGDHMEQTIETAIKYGHRNSKGSDRITDSCVRAIQYAANHSMDLVSTKEVQEFLEKLAHDKNPVIAQHASSINLLS